MIIESADRSYRAVLTEVENGVEVSFQRCLGITTRFSRIWTLIECSVIEEPMHRVLDATYALVTPLTKGP